MEEMKSHYDYLRALLYATGTDDGAWREIARELCRGAQSIQKDLKKFLFDVGRWYFIACLLQTPRSPILLTSKESQSVFRAVASYTGKVNLERGACLLLLLSSVRFPVAMPVSEISTYQGEGVSVAFL